MAEPTRPESPAPHWADDPEAPYFEHLYAVAQELQPGISRADALAALRTADPDNTLRITDPLLPDDGPGGERWSSTRCAACGHYPPCQCPGNPFGVAPPDPR